MYLNYPGVRNQFMEHEMSLLTPEQRAAVEKAQAAQLEAARALQTPAAPPPAPAGSAGRPDRLGRRSPRIAAELHETAEAGPPQRAGFFVPGSTAGGSGRGPPGVGRSSVASSHVMSGSERNHVRWRFANGPLRAASSSIAASRVESPSRTAHASR